MTKDTFVNRQRPVRKWLFLWIFFSKPKFLNHTKWIVGSDESNLGQFKSFGCSQVDKKCVINFSSTIENFHFFFDFLFFDKLPEILADSTKISSNSPKNKNPFCFSKYEFSEKFWRLVTTLCFCLKRRKRKKSTKAPQKPVLRTYLKLSYFTTGSRENENAWQKAWVEITIITVRVFHFAYYIRGHDRLIISFLYFSLSIKQCMSSN